MQRISMPIQSGVESLDRFYVFPCTESCVRMKWIAFRKQSWSIMESRRDHKAMQNVFHHGHDYADVGPEWIERLKTVALSSCLRRSRLCLHRSDDDSLHEMIIALARDC